MFDLQFFQTGQNNLLPNVVTTTLHGGTVGVGALRPTDGIFKNFSVVLLW